MIAYTVCPPLQYKPSKNAADQSGAIVPNFVSYEFKHLREQMKFVSRGRNSWASKLHS